MASSWVSTSLQSKAFVVKFGFITRSSIRHAKHAGLARANYVGHHHTAFHRLGLTQGASEQEIKKAYRKLALQFHPDVCKDESCTAHFMQINDAYESIMDCLQGNAGAWGAAAERFEPEPMMGVNDDTWEEWEEWMGWEGAGTRDYSSHINHSL